MSEDQNPTHVLARITEDPQLARAVPLLPPDVLHAVITRHGLPDCSELLALASPQQLAAVLDLDLWKPASAGADEQFDAWRFCEWLEVLVDLRPAVAAARVAHMDVALVIAGLAPHVRVFDIGVFEPTEERNSAEPVLNAGRERGVHAEVGGYVVVARGTDAWDAIVEILVALDTHQPTTFHRVMRGCRRLSNLGRERDGLDDLLTDAGQARFDLSTSRAQRRERLGFLSPEQARAFLASARGVSLTSEPPTRDPLFAEHVRSQTRSDVADRPPAGVIEILRDGGLLPDAPRALLTRGADDASPANAALDQYLRRVAERAPDELPSRDAELAFLANALLVGCSLQGRAFSRQEGGDAVAATCNLALECWPAQWGDPTNGDLVTVFRAGWAVLHRDVSLPSAAGVIDALDDLQLTDQELQFGLRVLRRELHRELQAGTPWRAHARLDALSPLDLPVWAALIGLLDECPVMLANVWSPTNRPALTINPSEPRFVSERRHVAAIREFVGSLAERLTS